jgi:hypothetical protein
MPLFNESIESIAQAIVTVKRALKEGVIEEENYKGVNDYLDQRAKDFKIKKSHLARANKNLDDELESEVEEFFMEVGDSLYKWAEELLGEFNDGNEKEAAEEPWLDEVRAIVAQADAKQKAQKTWANMDDMERAEMAALVNEWQKK